MLGVISLGNWPSWRRSIEPAITTGCVRIRRCKCVEEAQTEAIEALELTVRESAIAGIEEPVIYQGQVCYEPK